MIGRTFHFMQESFSLPRRYRYGYQGIQHPTSELFTRNPGSALLQNREFMRSSCFDCIVLGLSSATYQASPAPLEREMEGIEMKIMSFAHSLQTS